MRKNGTVTLSIHTTFYNVLLEDVTHFYAFTILQCSTPNKIVEFLHSLHGPINVIVNFFGNVRVN